MKKQLLLLLSFLFLVIGSYARNFYWIGGSGSWNDVSHWSKTSGGIHGSFIPTANDNVFFDNNSFNWGGETVQINTSVTCNSLTFSDDVLYPTLEGNSTAKLNIYGSLSISSNVKNNFFGNIYFKSSHSGNTINIGSSGFLQSDVYFDNSYGSWVMSSPLVLKGNHIIHLIAGNFSSMGNIIGASAINVATNAFHKKLDLSNSTVCLGIPFNWSGLASSYNSTHTHFSLNRIVFSNSTQSVGFQTATIFLSPDDSIHIKYKEPLCNGQCNGEIITTNYYIPELTSGPYSYFWVKNGSPNDTIYNDTITNLCSQFYTFIVEDLGTSPNPTYYNFTYDLLGPVPLTHGGSATNHDITCFGDCNGAVHVNFNGGTGAYTYSWLPGGQTTAIATNLCVGTYSVTLSDANGCTSSASATLTQPPIINPIPHLQM